MTTHNPITRRRHRRNRVAMVFSIFATAVGLFILAAILWELLWQGLGGLNMKVFTEITPPPGSDGGLSNAIYGSIMLTLVGIAIAAPIGILAGTYLSEYARGSKIGEAAKFINDVLLSAPSIIVGLFINAILVVPFGTFSAWAGAVALAVIALPVINRTTQDMLALVPNTLREAAAALGAPRWKVLVFIVWRAAKSGILTGVLLAIARISGETAPLLFTSFGNQFWSTDMGKPMANLPVVIYQFAMSPYSDWQRLAWVGALLITSAILFLNILARSLAARSR
ncbi:phosphate transporter permease subunit PtsA [Defluviimonas sp. 20V17]|uniref:Phosphate transport system permease protein PstA n=1 Tax=Allgaiera indica TaxID=765699 RepID=A0AAN4USY6_9RHOB|nr:phosphate ABC transporter permease PstA [Allgaiera indica]KDB05520.1 phosphate transporter permease subunit PtsA [Defluviimonas sp. 20V17]GHE03521.1 phosphate transport system permease protein PstA [Allgaiera indica]SDX43388.1 phosphate ABC transporter membrane protein 2, PhoT family [Allgaiera indica]